MSGTGRWLHAREGGGGLFLFLGFRLSVDFLSEEL
jgi:hypothetical protein